MQNITIRDSGNKEVLEAYFLNHEGQPYNLENKTVTFMENKDGDKFVSDPNVQIVNATAGFVRYTLQSQVHSASGIAWFEINDDSGLVDSTGNFNIRVENGLRATADNTTYISDLEKLKQQMETQMETLIQQADGELKTELQKAEQQFNQELQNVFYPDVTEVKIDHINTGYISQWDGSVKTDKSANPDDGDPIHTDMIAVKPDEEYYVYTQNYYDGKAVIFFNQDKVVSSLPAEKDVKRKNIKITIPHNVNGLILNSTRNFLPRLFKVESYFEIPQPVKSIASLIKDQEYNFEKVELTKKAEVGFWDIDHDGNFWIEPVNKTNAQISYEPIKVEPFEVYRISGCSAWNARLYEIIDAKGHLIDYCSTEMSNNMTETIMIPENGSYLEINEYLLNAQTTLEKADFIKKKLPLSGKTWTAVGDSWTQLFSDQKKSYVNDVAEITGATAINSGGGGTGYIAGGPNNWNYQFYKHPVDSNSDIVTVFGSFNDAYDSNFKFGKQGDTDTNTLWGALKATLDHIYSSNFDAQVGIIAPGPWGAINQHLDATIKMSTLVSHSDSEVNDMPIADFAEKYVQTLHDFAKLNSLPFLDLYHYSGLRPWDSTFINKHYHGTNDTDTTHPNSEAMNKFIAPKVAEFIKSFA